MALGRSAGARVGGEAASLKGPKAKAHWAWPVGLFRVNWGVLITPPKWRCLGMAPEGRPIWTVGVVARGLGRTLFVLSAPPIRTAGSALGGVRVNARAVPCAVATRACARRDKKPPRGTFCPKRFCGPPGPPPPLLAHRCRLAERRRWVESGPFAAEASLSLFSCRRGLLSSFSLFFFFYPASSSKVICPCLVPVGLLRSTRQHE